MATALANPDLDRVTAIGHTQGGEKWVNVFHINHMRAPGSPLTLAIATTYRDRFETFYRALVALQDQNYGLDQIVTKNMDIDRQGEQFELTPATALSGTNTAGALPSQDAIVVSWRTVLAGRRHRGRTYLAGFAKVAVDPAGVTLTPTNQTVIGNAAKALMVGLAVDLAPLVIWSRVVANPTTDPGVNTEVTSLRIGRVFDTQRRRRNKFNEAYVSF